MSYARAQETTIDIWYGDEQKFGFNGTPQHWINILGNVSDPSGISTLTYSLNGEDPVSLSIGPDTRRLQNEGDFNIDIHVRDLREGDNKVLITAVNGRNQTVGKEVTVTYTSGKTWPVNYTFNWDTVTRIQNVVQVVDGKWEITEQGIRTAEPGYDRLLAIGDITWQNYEIEIPITVHKLVPPLGINSGNHYGLGVIMLWQGHTDTLVYNWQPKSGYLPLGDIGWFTWPSNNDNPTNIRYFFDGSVEYPIISGETYIFKLQVLTQPGRGILHKMKVWKEGDREPFDWSLRYFNEKSLLSEGSLMLVAHHVDATFGNPVIKPAGLVSDDFGNAALSQDWVFVDPTGDGDFSLHTGTGSLHLSVPGAAAHDPWSGSNRSLRLMQAASDTDFGVEVKFGSPLNGMYQMQGILIQQDPENYLRFDFHSEAGRTVSFSAAVVNGIATAKSSQDIGETGISPLYMRVIRTGSNWQMAYSFDGRKWFTTASFQHHLTVSQAGVFVGNSGNPPPSHTAIIDYFNNMAHPAEFDFAGEGDLVRAFPNPVTDNIFALQFIKGAKKVASVELLNVAGSERILSLDHQSPQELTTMHFDITSLHLPTGIYLLRINYLPSGYDIIRLVVINSN